MIKNVQSHYHTGGHQAEEKTNFIENVKRHIILDTYLVNSHDQAGGCLKELVNNVPNGRITLLNYTLT